MCSSDLLTLVPALREALAAVDRPDIMIVVGVSSLAAGHLTLVPALREALAAVDRPDIMIVVGGVIPPGDFEELHAAGAAAIFPPGTVIADAAIGLVEKLSVQLGHAPHPSEREASA